ncbi:MAG: hypothetical protein G01um101416_431 [Microgenomates group bacterium Gr01-1014_16]|nr:MAG: hypothetical protein G01um101416_431 [Microgenomates group bacterium Gr01-1014_16]
MSKIKIAVGAGLAAFFILSTGVFTAGFLARGKMREDPELVRVLVDPILDVEEVSRHNSQEDCWLIISGNVYSLTKFLAQHPGGSKPIIPYCGKDGTMAFSTKDLNPAREHSSLADDLLAQYLIGKLGQPITPDPGVLPNLVGPIPTTVPMPVAKNLQEVIVPAPATLALVDVARHNSSGDCWLVISGGVYDVTGYIYSHPGGVDVIVKYCGQEASSAFGSKDQSPGKNHSGYAYGLLSQYLVGNIGSPLAQLQPTAIPAQSGNSPVAPPPPIQVQPGSSLTITTQEVALHNNSQNCWLIISDKVYNVTSYIIQHPGGSQTIVSRCGTDATTAFQTKGQQSGSSHSNNANNLLNNYFVGNLGSTVPVNPPTSTATPVSDVNNCQEGTLPSNVSSKYPGATIKEQTVEDDCKQELEIIYNGQCRKIKTNSSGSITEDKSC